MSFSRYAIPSSLIRLLAFCLSVVVLVILFFPHRSQQNWFKVGFVEGNYTSPEGEKYKYTLFVPPSYDPSSPTPLIVFLHDAREQGIDGRSPIKVGLGPALQYSLQNPTKLHIDLIALFPQSRSSTWHPESSDGLLVMAEIEDVCSKFNIDPSRIYLTGHSTGGTGTWELAASYPDRWAAIAPVCGWSNPRMAEHIQNVPCWCFHGDADRSIPITVSRDMVKAMKEVGGKCKLTEYKGLDHNIWRKVYMSQTLYDWFLQHQLARKS